MPITVPPLPTIDFTVDGPTFDWPQPPFARRDTMAPLPEGSMACKIETLNNGVAVTGELIEFDPEAGIVRFRMAAQGAPLSLPFNRFRRLTLTTPWLLARRAPDAPVERLPAAAQERDYRIDLHEGGHLSGRTMGHVTTPHGLFFFSPSEDGRAVTRVFVPQAACLALTLGKSAEEAAIEHWVATPDELLRAIEAQRHSRIMSMGDALVALGLVTRGVIELTLRQQGPGREAPLGEMLIAAGYLERADLQITLAYKMGYPIVDLTRFPIDPLAARKLSQRTLLEHHALPLMQQGQRLFVAVDDLARMPALKALQGLAGLEIVPVLAPRGRLALVLSMLPQRLGSDLWASNVHTKAKTAPG